MNLRSIRTYGKSRVGSTWMGRRLRSVLWRLMLPYFEGIGAELDRSLQESMAATEQRLAAMSAMIHAPRDEAAAAIDPRVEAELVSIRAEGVALAARLAAARKDATAIAHRLAGIEEELGRMSPPARADSARRQP